ncbi:cell division protein FtsQ/DivIB [Colwellia psychrerythraea]|uniref:Cell division protein FtsQ n=1 Tax=Colwellia psychrerythraea (strain 34H / ATCC BAA-681) TaxID=167879 RepID=Q47VR2_COLP3|nr:cell division protein FtsQ/DivIB [Colwellia psychrerythraea]AAZ27519.1 cell division protein FtsQ [Colwellia psychrerythraea 34H]
MTKKQQGNSNKTAQLGQDSTLSFGLGLVFFIVVLFSLITVSYWLTQHFIGQESAPVTSIVVSGEMPYSKRSDIINAIDQVDMGNFFQVDVNEVQSYVLTLPWVYSVAVRKQWPNELKIYVVDQNPIALWNGDFLINQLGQVFQADIERINHYLPNFFGPEGSELLALENYRDLNALLDYKALKIDELVLSERFSWQLTLDDGVTLNLGREERVERIQRFMDVYPIIKAQLKAKKIAEKQQNQAVDYIDLRYDTGLAVGWKTVDSITQHKTQSKLQKNNNKNHPKLT